MKKLLKKIGIFICAFLGIIFISNSVYASTGLSLKNLNYDVNLNFDGSANITETWEIRITDTNTLFKTFEIDNSKYKGITDVEVEEVTRNGNINFNKSYQYKYNVDKNYFYALMNNGKFEIAWGAYAKNVIKTYKISYKIIDAVKNYDDCSEFYWQFISEESEIPADFVIGTITLPKDVIDIEDLRIWAHGPLNGDIKKTSNNTVKFTVEDFPENTMLEARIVTPKNIFSRKFKYIK